MIKELFHSLKNRYQNLLYYNCHKINPSYGRSHIESPDCIKTKKLAIDSTNKKDNKCLQYALRVALYHEEAKKDWQRITNIKKCINN